MTGRAGAVRGADFVHLDGNGVLRTPGDADFVHLDDNGRPRLTDSQPEVP